MRKALSLFLSFILCTSSSGIAEATKELLHPASRPFHIQLNPPSKLGYLTDHFEAKNSERPLVILIQDLHVHYGAQKNIAGILEFLTRKLTPSTVAALPFALAVEGAAGPIDSSVLALFPDAKIKAAAADYLVKQGELSGPEYFTVMRGLPDALVGVENDTYYQLNRELFRKTFKERDRYVRLLRGMQADLQLLKEKAYSPKRKRFDERLKKFEQGKIRLSAILKLLEKEAESIGLDVRSLRKSKGDQIYDNIASVAYLIRMEMARNDQGSGKSMALDLVQVEQDLALLLKVTDLRATEKDVRSFGPRLNQFVALASALLSDTETRRGGDAENLRELISSSIDYYAMAMMRNQPMVDNTLRLIGQNLELNNGTLAPNGRTFLPKGGTAGHKPVPGSRVPLLGNKVPTYGREVLLHGSSDVAVLVTGGFHTAPITQILRKKKISYLVITPRVDSLSDADHALYVKRLNGQSLTARQVVADAKHFMGKRDKDALHPGYRLAGAMALIALAVAAYGAPDLTQLASQFAVYAQDPHIAPELLKANALLADSAAGAGGIATLMATAPTGVPFQEPPVPATTHASDGAQRLNALRRWLRMRGVDIEVWADQQASRMRDFERRQLREAFLAMGLSDSQIQALQDRIVLVDVPDRIGLEGKTSRIGGLIIRTQAGPKILFPKDRIVSAAQNLEYLADLYHEVIELELIGQGLSVEAAHEEAMRARTRFLQGWVRPEKNFKELFEARARRDLEFDGFDTIFVERVAADFEISDAYLMDTAPRQGKVYHVTSKSGSRYLFLVDEAGNVEGVAVDQRDEGEFAITSMNPEAGFYHLLSRQASDLFQRHWAFYAQRLQESGIEIPDHTLEYGSIRYTDKLKGKLFFPLINRYYGLTEVHNDYINNHLFRHIILAVGVKTLLALRGSVRLILGGIGRTAAAISFGGHTSYDLHTLKTMDRFPLHHLSRVVHEFTHELYAVVPSAVRMELVAYFHEQRSALINLVRLGSTYSNLNTEQIVNEVIAQVIGQLADGLPWVSMQDAVRGTHRTMITGSDIEILIKTGFLPGSFMPNGAEKTRFANNEGAIDLLYLSRVYPQARLRYEEHKRFGGNDKILGAMHEPIMHPTSLPGDTKHRSDATGSAKGSDPTAQPDASLGQPVLAALIGTATLAVMGVMLWIWRRGKLATAFSGQILSPNARERLTRDFKFRNEEQLFTLQAQQYNAVRTLNISQDASRYLYRGMRVRIDDLEDVLKAGLKRSRSTRARNYVTTRPKTALDFAIWPGSKVNSKLLKEDFFVVIFQIERGKVDSSANDAFEIELEKDIPASAILKTYVLSVADEMVDLASMSEIDGDPATVSLGQAQESRAAAPVTTARLMSVGGQVLSTAVAAFGLKLTMAWQQGVRALDIAFNSGVKSLGHYLNTVSAVEVLLKALLKARVGEGVEAEVHVARGVDDKGIAVPDLPWGVAMKIVPQYSKAGKLVRVTVFINPHVSLETLRYGIVHEIFHLLEGKETKGFFAQASEELRVIRRTQVFLDFHSAEVAEALLHARVVVDSQMGKPRAKAVDLPKRMIQNLIKTLGLTKEEDERAQQELIEQRAILMAA